MSNQVRCRSLRPWPGGTATLAAVVLLAFVFASCAATPTAKTAEPVGPHPLLSPKQVVELQITALRTGGDEGIEVAFRFASPANRALTGPVERFGSMIRSGYGIMLTFDRVLYYPTLLGNEYAAQRVLFFLDGRRFVFDFLLHRQTEAPYEGCWMTEAVYAQVPVYEEALPPVTVL